MSINRVALAPNDIHVWIFTPSDSVRDLRDAYEALLSRAERERYDRYRVEHARDGYLRTRALVRTTLSRYVPDVRPDEWEFVEVGNRRPEIAPGMTPCRIRFNASRTEGLIACGVSLDRAVGVDVERIDRRCNTAGIAERFFAPFEQRALRECDPSRADEEFFSYWTLKESYIKAIGQGLAFPLERFGFDLEAPPAIAISFDPSIDDSPGRWQFALERPTPDHLLAVAGEVTGGRTIDITLRKTVPLQ